MYAPDDTIAAIASANGRGARGVIRISGDQTAQVLAKCILGDAVDWLQASKPCAVDGAFRLSSRDGLIPATVYFWPTTRSYTRQSSAEIHTVGSRPLLAAVLDEVCNAGARLAQPGEFTLRAFLAGRLDLTQAEAVLGVIDARGQDDLRQALEQLSGGMTRPLHALRESLLDILAHLEAGLDFVEEDIEFIGRSELDARLASATSVLEATMSKLQSRKRQDVLPRVVLVGYPNVGKSSLFNALGGMSVALVSHEPGTTRDYLTAKVDLGGVSCELIDTAGYESVGDSTSIPGAAQVLASSVVSHADVELICLDSTRPLNAWESTRLTQPPAGVRLVVATKCDATEIVRDLTNLPHLDVIATSAISGTGLLQLRQKLQSVLADAPSGDLAAIATSDRCADSLTGARDAMALARLHCVQETGDELVAAELRLALAELGKVVGAVYTDDVLDRVFSRFCIGK